MEYIFDHFFDHSGGTAVLDLCTGRLLDGLTPLQCVVAVVVAGAVPAGSDNRCAHTFGQCAHQNDGTAGSTGHVMGPGFTGGE